MRAFLVSSPGGHGLKDRPGHLPQSLTLPIAGKIVDYLFIE